MASQVSVNAASFHELWPELSKPNSTEQERASVYQKLANYLKGGDVIQDFISTLSWHHKQILQFMLDDITGMRCAQEAIQLLGYCLFTPQFAEVCAADAAKIIGVLCTVPYNETAEKSIVMRALWCLSSQNFHSAQISHCVPQIVRLATDVIMEHGFGSLAVEALNVFVRINQQCPKEFGLVASMWYKGIIVLLQCKVAKFQRKAHNFVVAFESAIASNSYLVGYLSKELKEHVISTLLGYMEERGKDPILILNIWSHFVSVLGHTLHKHSSFLNEMLRVVEVGFKHKVFLVQVAAYSSWKALINNFSIDIDLLTQQRRLKLLLMPLLASAVKDRHDQVELARLQTWWHLIRKLGASKEALFHQVCIPFLLFCLGVDPKLDLSALPSILADVASRNHTPATPNGTPHLNQVTQNKENVPTSGRPTGQEKTPSGQGLGSLRAGRLLALLSTSLSSSGKKSDRYPNTPKFSVVLSGCHALLQFLGFEGKLQGSLLDTDAERYAVFSKQSVPFGVIQFIMAFLDGALLYMVHYSSEVKGTTVDYLVSSIFPVFLCSLRQESLSDAKAAANLAVLLTSMLKWEAVVTHVATSTRLDILSQFNVLPATVTTILSSSYGPQYWLGVAQELIAMAPTEHYNSTFLNCWIKLVTVLAGQDHGNLTSFGDLCNLLDRFVELVIADGSKKQHHPVATLSRMWIPLAQNFNSFVSETSHVNQGTALDPDFSATRHILNIPFRHIFYSAEKQVMSLVFETWKDTYDIFSIHTSLIVKDPNHCAELVCKDLYDAYGQNVRSDSATLDKGETLVFDSYQNSVGLALTRVLAKFNWVTLKTSAGGGERGTGMAAARGKGAKSQREVAMKNVQSLISLLSWQLATLWDTVQRSPMHIGSLTSPYTLMDTVTLLYNHLPSTELIHTTTEVLAQPMATLWHNVMETDLRPVAGNKGALKARCQLPERIAKTWKCILTCFQCRYTGPFNSDVLSVLSPLLVFALSSKKQDLVNLTLSFWTATFGSAEHLDYPNKLRDIFVQLGKQSNLILRLPGFKISGKVSIEDSQPLSDSVIVSKPSHAPPTTSEAEQPTTVIVPHPSPQKGVRGSFLAQNRSPKLSVTKTPPRSPSAQAMDEILARSHARQQSRAGQSGEGSAAKSPAPSARRRLSLNSDRSDDFVAVEPPAKKQHLLTEHQKEKLHERSDSIPAMYNDLDPSQDASQLSAEPSVPDSASDEPIIIPESEGSPAAAVHTRPVVPSTSSEFQTSSTDSSATSSAAKPSSSTSTRVATIWQPPPSMSISAEHSQAAIVSRAIGTLSGSVAASTARSVIAKAVGTGVQGAQGQGMQVAIRSETLHVRKSPISSRTRSRLRPVFGEVLIDPVSRGLPFPLPVSLAGGEMQPHPSHSWSFVTQTVSTTGQVVTRPVITTDPATLQNTRMSLPLSQLPMSPVASSSTSTFVSPTDQHYQSRHAPQHVYPVSGAVVSPTSQQQVYQMHFDSNTGRTIMMPVPLHKQVISSGVGSHIVHSGPSLGQFVPAGSRVIHSTLRSPTSPSVSVPPLPHTVSPKSLSPQDPTFPPARYILRPSRNRSPPPYPASPLPPMQIQHSHASSEPLPLSAVVRPDLSMARRVARPRKTSFTQQSVPAQVSVQSNPSYPASSVAPPHSTEVAVSSQCVVTPLTAPPSEPAPASLIGSVESPIVIEDMEDPLARVPSDKQHPPHVETAGKDPTGDKQDLAVVEQVQETGPTGDLAVTGDDVQVLCSSSISGDTRDVPLPHGLDKSSTDVSSVQRSEGAEVEIGEVMINEQDSTNSRQDSGDTIVTLSSKPPSTDSTTLTAVPSESKENLHEMPADAASKKISGKVEGRLGISPTEESDDSCQPGPALLGSMAHSEEVGPGSCDGNEHTNKMELNTPPQATDGNVAGDGDIEEVRGDSHVSATSSSTVENLREEAQNNDSETQQNVQHLDSNNEERAEAVKVDDNGTVEPEIQNSLGSITSKTESATEKQIPSDAVSTVNTAVDTVLEASPVHALKDTLPTPATPTNTVIETQDENVNSPKTTPGGILKYTSQFDTPTSAAGKVRRVQFANNPVVFQPPKGEEESFKTPKPSRTRTPLSSRRTLLKSDPSSRMIQVNKGSPSASTEPVYPSLANCDSPVEDILPVLSPSRRFTHGLVQLVHARNIRTVGNISSLTEQQIQTLPIKSPKVENLKQALRSFQNQLGTKRRASLDSDSLGPPAKVQKRNDHVAEKDAQESSSEVVADGDDSDSQLSLTSQPSQSEPDVVLSSPDDKPGGVAVGQDEGEPLKSAESGGVTAERDEGEPLKSAGSGGVTAERDEGEPLKSDEMIDSDDDNVFVEETRETTGTDDENNFLCSKSEATAVEGIKEDEVVVRTDSAMDTGHHSPAVTVASPEVPVQSEQSSTEDGLSYDATVNQATDGGNVEGGVTSEEQQMEMEQGDSDGGGQSVEQKQSNLEHDHSYISSCQHQNLTDGETQSRSSDVPIATLTDHAYCSMTKPASPPHQPAQQLQHESQSARALTELRSKLSSDVQDHNYCRLSPRDVSPTTPEPMAVECNTQPGAGDSRSPTESQELFSVDVMQQDNLNVVNAEPCSSSSSASQMFLSDTAVTLVHVGCQTNAPFKPETAEKSTSIDNNALPTPSPDTSPETSINSSLKSVIDLLAAQDDLPTSTLWRVHQHLLQGLGLVSEKLFSKSP